MTDCLVRPATMDDAVAIIRVMLDHHAENGLAPVNVEKGSRFICGLIVDPHAVVLVCESRGAIVGAAAIRVDSWWYSDEEALFERFIFVHPEARRTRAGILLTNAMKAYADQHGLTLGLTIVTPVRLFDKIGFFIRLGFSQIGALLFYRPAR